MGWNSTFTTAVTKMVTGGRFLDCKSWAVRHSPTFFSAFCSAKVGHRRMAQLDRSISMTFAQQKTYEKSTQGVKEQLKMPYLQCFKLLHSFAKNMKNMGLFLFMRKAIWCHQPLKTFFLLSNKLQNYWYKLVKDH